MYTVFLAYKYVKSRLVNLAAVLAVALALTVQIVVTAVLDGQLEDSERRVRDLGGQIAITFRNEYPSAGECEALREKLLRIDGVRGVTPLVAGGAVLEKDGFYAYVEISGIDLAQELRQSKLASHLKNVAPDSSGNWFGDKAGDGKYPPLYLGKFAADNLGAAPGDAVVLSYMRAGEEKVRRKTFTMVSWLLSGTEQDYYGAYAPLEIAQEIFLDTGEKPAAERPVGALSIWLQDPYAANALEERIGRAVVAEFANRLGMRIGSNTWQKRWSHISEGMKHENDLQTIILFMITLSSVFCVFAIISTLVSRRVRDVGLLRCIGASRTGIVAVFLLVGLAIGIAGTLLGLAGGYCVAEPGLFFVKRPLLDVVFEYITGHPLYPPHMFGIEELPILIKAWKVLAYAAASVLLSVLAAAYPAFCAGRREPMEALRDG